MAGDERSEPPDFVASGGLTSFDPSHPELTFPTKQSHFKDIQRIPLDAISLSDYSPVLRDGMGGGSGAVRDHECEGGHF